MKLYGQNLTKKEFYEKFGHISQVGGIQSSIIDDGKGSGSCCLLLMLYELDLCTSGRCVSVHVDAYVCFQFARISHNVKCWFGSFA